MELDVEQKCNAPKGVHKEARISYYSSYRFRKSDTRIGILYILVPKLRNGGFCVSPSVMEANSPCVCFLNSVCLICICRWI
jgi:transposase-like protein